MRKLEEGRIKKEQRHKQTGRISIKNWIYGKLKYTSAQKALKAMPKLKFGVLNQDIAQVLTHFDALSKKNLLLIYVRKLKSSY